MFAADEDTKDIELAEKADMSRMLCVYRYWAERGISHTVVDDAPLFYIAAYEQALDERRRSK